MRVSPGWSLETRPQDERRGAGIRENTVDAKGKEDRGRGVGGCCTDTDTPPVKGARPGHGVWGCFHAGPSSGLSFLRKHTCPACWTYRDPGPFSPGRMVSLCHLFPPKHLPLGWRQTCFSRLFPADWTVHPKDGGGEPRLPPLPSLGCYWAWPTFRGLEGRDEWAGRCGPGCWGRGWGPCWAEAGGSGGRRDA